MYSSVQDFLLAVAQIGAYQLNSNMSGLGQDKLAIIEVKLNNYELHPFSGIANVASSSIAHGAIFLYSSNYLRRFTSLFRSRDSGVWHVEKADTEYVPAIINPDFFSIDDPDIYGLIGLDLPKAVAQYRYIVQTQAAIIREVCHANGLSFVPVSYESFNDNPSATAELMLGILAKFFPVASSHLSLDDIIAAILRSPLRKTGFNNIIEGISSESLAILQSFPDHNDYLPGGRFDLEILEYI